MNLFGAGPGELLLVLVVALIVFGPGKLPEIAGSIGRAIREFRRTTQELTAEFQREFNVNDLIDPKPAPSANGAAKPDANAASTVAYSSPAPSAAPADAAATATAAAVAAAAPAPATPSAPAGTVPSAPPTPPPPAAQSEPALASYTPIADEDPVTHRPAAAEGTGAPTLGEPVVAAASAAPATPAVAHVPAVQDEATTTLAAPAADPAAAGSITSSAPADSAGPRPVPEAYTAVSVAPPPASIAPVLPSDEQVASPAAAAATQAAEASDQSAAAAPRRPDTRYLTVRPRRNGPLDANGTDGPAAPRATRTDTGPEETGLPGETKPVPPAVSTT